jgi:hypothetical protein
MITETKLGRRKAELRALSRQQVAAKRQRQAAAEAEAPDHGDHRLAR